MRVLLIGGTGPVGQASVPFLLADGHEVAVAHSGAHEPRGGSPASAVEHLHGARDDLLRGGGPVERFGPDVLVDTFAGGATAAKAAQHDNVAMEGALAGAARITVLRPGAIYGPWVHPRVLREWYLVGRVARGEHALALPDGGTQLFHRVALSRVGRAVAAAVARAPEGRWACNVADPADLTFGGLARLVAERLGWSWQPVAVPWADGEHPWNVRHPVLADVGRLREGLGVHEPDPLEATLAQVDWLWEQREAFAAAGF